MSPVVPAYEAMGRADSHGALSVKSQLCATELGFNHDVTDNPVRSSRAARAVQPGQPGRSHAPNAGSGLSIAPCLQTPLRRPDVVQVVVTLRCAVQRSTPEPLRSPQMAWTRLCSIPWRHSRNCWYGRGLVKIVCRQGAMERPEPALASWERPGRPGRAAWAARKS